MKDEHLLVMHRNKFGKTYDTLPGGGVEPGEDLQQALIREIAEETMVVVAEPRLVFVEHAGEPYGDQYVFVCEYISGEPQLHPDSQEYQIHKLGKNLYMPSWVSFSELPSTPFVSENLRQKILEVLRNGWSPGITEF